MTPEALIEMLMPIVAALLYSGVFFFKKYVDVENEKTLKETFNPRKFGVTLGIGACLAGLMIGLGQPVGMNSMMEMLLLYEGVIMSVDQSLKALIRGNEKQARRHARDAGEEAAETTASYYYSDKDDSDDEEVVIENGP